MFSRFLAKYNPKYNPKYYNKDKDNKAKINNIPEETLSHIFSYLPSNEKPLVGATSKLFKAAMEYNYKDTESLKIKPGCNNQKTLKPYIGGKLKILDLSANSRGGVTSKDLEFISKNFPDLLHLNLKRRNINDAQIGKITTLTKLQNLDLGSCDKITDAGIQKIAASFTNLEQLSLSNCDNLTDDGIKIIADSLTKLKSLDIECTELTDNGIKIIADGLTHLEQLNIDYCQKITNDGIKIIADGLTNLKYLSIGRDGGSKLFTDEGYAHLASLKELKHLSLSSCPHITDTGIEIIATSLTNLQYLHIDDSIYITDAGIEKIATSLINLERLKFTNCHTITNNVIKFIAANLKNLKYLSFENCKSITKDGIDRIKKLGIRVDIT